MLDRGSDPPHLKRRIASEEGHLDNAAAAELLTRLAHPRLRQLWLAHLSTRNNRPELALAAAASALRGRAEPVVRVARRDGPTPITAP